MAAQGNIIKEGSLLKEGGMIRNWKRRWFVLKDNKQINYYETKGGKMCGCIDLKKYRKVCNTKIGGHKKGAAFKIECSDRTWKILAKDGAERDEWTTAIKTVTEHRASFMMPPMDPNHGQRPSLLVDNTQPTLNTPQQKQNAYQPPQPTQTSSQQISYNNAPSYDDAPSYGDNVTPQQQVEGVPSTNKVSAPAATIIAAPAAINNNTSSTEGALPHGWVEAFDHNNQRTYYVNHDLQQTSWTKPVAESAAPPANPQYPSIQVPASLEGQPNQNSSQQNNYSAPPPNNNNYTAPPPKGNNVNYIPHPSQQKQPVTHGGRVVAYQPPPPKQVAQPNNISYPAPQSFPQQQKPVAYSQPPMQNYQQPPVQQYRPPPVQQPAPNQPAYQTLPTNLAPPTQMNGFTRFDEGRLGLEFKLMAAKYVIIKVKPNTPAAHKGVRVGQAIESVYDGYGHPVQASTASQLAQQMSYAPRPLMIKFVESNARMSQRCYAPRPHHVYRRNHGLAVAGGIFAGLAIASAFAGSNSSSHHHGHHGGRRHHHGHRGGRHHGRHHHGRRGRW